MTEPEGCALCGAGPVWTVWKDDPFQYGPGPDAPVIEVRVPVRHCQSCGEEWTDWEAEQIRDTAIALYKAAAKEAEHDA